MIIFDIYMYAEPLISLESCECFIKNMMEDVKVC